MLARFLCALLWALSASALGAVATTTVDEADAGFDSGVFAAYPKQPFPTALQLDVDDVFTINFNTYCERGRNYTSPVNGAISPTCAWAGNAIAGASLTTDANNHLCVYGGTATTASTGTGTPTCDNAQGAAVTGSVAWTVTAAGGSETPITQACAISRFVRSTGNNTADGCTHLTAWKTLDHVGLTLNTASHTGVDVWLLDNNQLSGKQLRVDWDGTAANRVIIGAYKVIGGVPYVGLTDEGDILTPGATDDPGSRPIVQGTYAQSCRPRRAASPQCAYNSSAAVPSTRDQGLVYVLAAYVTVQDLEVAESAGYGILVDGPGSTTHTVPPAWYPIIQRNYIHHTAAGAGATQDVSYPIIRQNNGAFTDLAFADGLHTDWNATFMINRANPSNALMEDNYIHDNMGEGFGVYRASYAIVRGNKAANGARVNYYSGRAHDNVYEQNMDVGGLVDDQGYCYIGPDPNDPPTTISRCYNFTNPAFSSLNETLEEYSVASTPVESSERILFRNNLSSNAQTCHQWGAVPTNLGSFFLSGKHVGNTCVIGPAERWINVGPSTANAGLIDAAGIEFANNLYAATAATTGTNCVAGTYSTKLSMHHNGQTTLFSDADCRGTGDVVSTQTGFGSFSFATATKLNFPAYSDFELVGTSAFDEVGQAMTANYLSLVNFPQRADFQWSPCGNPQLSGANWIKTLAADYCDELRTTDDMGALND